MIHLVLGNARKTGTVSDVPPKEHGSFFVVWRYASVPFALTTGKDARDQGAVAKLEPQVVMCATAETAWNGSSLRHKAIWVYGRAAEPDFVMHVGPGGATGRA